MRCTVCDFPEYVRFHGRTVPTEQAVYFNWTCTGFRCRFLGKRLNAALTAVHGHVEADETPWLGISETGGDTLLKRLPLEEGVHTYTLFESDTEDEHDITVWKLSENARGKSGLCALETDGAFLPLPEEAPRRCFEVIGDSITCGYGNEAAGKDEPFRPEEENGFISYWMLAARELNWDARAVSVSGITTSVDENGFHFPGMKGMDELIPYADAMFETENPRPWDYDDHPCDAVVINLGTNDVNAYKIGNIDGARAFFHRRYGGMLRQVRRLYGPRPVILCTLGPLDYYLYDEIKEIAEAYRKETGDTRLLCYKFGGVILWSEGFGAVGHPSAKTHVRMGRELADLLKNAVPEE